MKEMRFLRAAKTKAMIQLMDKMSADTKKVFWANTSKEAYEKAKQIKTGTDILAVLTEKDGELPFVEEVYTLEEYKNAAKSLPEPTVEKVTPKDEVEIETIKMEAHPPLEPSSQNLDIDDDSNYYKELTAETIQVLVGNLNINNIEEAITKIYNTYKNLK